MLNRQDKEIEKKSIFLKLKPYSSSRYGFNTPPNYNDHELYCGGYSRQWRTNGGHCGICGDPWDTKQVICSVLGKDLVFQFRLFKIVFFSIKFYCVPCTIVHYGQTHGTLCCGNLCLVLQLFATS